MTSDDEWTTPTTNTTGGSSNNASTPRRLFNLKLVNSYGNANIDSLLSEVDPATATIQLAAKNYIALDWHPRARSLFYSDKAAEEVSQDEASFHPDKVAATATAKKQTLGLTECLKLYTSQEKLGADDAWYCPACKKHQQASKKFDLWTLPEVLIIHLKRFSYNRYWRDKIDTLIDFPIEVSARASPPPFFFFVGSGFFGVCILTAQAIAVLVETNSKNNFLLIFSLGEISL